jgi:hypothetical protein
MQFDQMQFRAVAFVLAEAILGKARAEVSHNRVARDLGDHTRGGDAEAEAIAIDNRGLWQWEREDRKAVDENVVGRETQGVDGGAHRLVGGAQDIDRVNLDGVDNSDGPRDRLIIDQFAVNLFAAFCQKLLRIVEPAMPEFFGEDDGGGYDRPGECAATCLINAGDHGDTEGA